MMIQLGIFLVCVATAAFFGAKAAREVVALMRQKSAEKMQKTTDTEEQRRRAARVRREIENFMSYDGRAREDSADEIS